MPNMNLLLWSCVTTLIWTQVKAQGYNEEEQLAGREGQPKPPAIPGQGDTLPFRPGGGYSGPGAGPGATFGFSSFKGPVNGNFDSSLRQFTKVHTLGSFGNSFEGHGDHENVMNKVYDRLKKNGAGHYSKDPPSNDDANNNNRNQNNYRNNRNRNQNSNRNRNQNSNRNRNQNRQQQRSRRRPSQRSNQRYRRNARNNRHRPKKNSYPYPTRPQPSRSNPDNDFFSGKDPFPDFGYSSSGQKSSFPSNFYDYSDPYKNSKNSYNSVYGSANNNRRPQGYNNNNNNNRNSGYQQQQGSYPRQQRSNGYGNQGYYPNQKSQGYSPYNRAPSHGNGYGRGPGYAPRRGYLGDSLHSTPGGTTLLQVTNARVPRRGGGGTGFGGMLEDGGATSSLIQITSANSGTRNLNSGGGFNYENILEEDHSLTDLVSAVATLVGQGNVDVNPAALQSLGAAPRRPPPQQRRHVFNDVGRRRRPPLPPPPPPPPPADLHTGPAGAYDPGPGYGDGTYVTGYNGDGGGFLSSSSEPSNQFVVRRGPDLNHIVGDNAAAATGNSVLIF